MFQLNELQYDALRELFNLGVGRAARSLSLMVQDAVELSTPVVTLVKPADVATTLLGSEFRQLSLVMIDFTGPFDAQAILLFPERNALAIISHMLDPDMSPEELSEFEQEAMCEIGNIILNACISALADEFAVEFQGGLPMHYFSDTDSLPLLDLGGDRIVLLLQIHLTMRQERIQGHLIFLLSVSSLAILRECVDAYLTRVGVI
ncbi:chemotaxis protein CheX [uncultured Thiocystis sp.]|uniref:chemotaxis protein CheX n=1 Tax=uncultured Thiocystis sp. TaxID=1202134 RepID=UPI0025D9A732|nr:chemotaxis protein CheX [uncultured Thiocystis sp.]